MKRIGEIFILLLLVLLSPSDFCGIRRRRRRRGEILTQKVGEGRATVSIGG